MRRDLIIGILVSLFIHGGFLFGEKLFKSKPPEKPKAEAAPTIEAIVMPPIEPDKPEEETPPDEATPNVLAPPSLLDVPTVVPVEALVQPLQPPPPEGIQKTTSAVTIPVNRPTGKGLGEIFNPKDLDQPLQDAYLRKEPKPPEEMRRLGINGEVLVELIVDPKGLVADAYVVKSNNPAFNEPTLEAVRQWRFRIPKKGGKPVSVRARVAISIAVKGD